MKERMTGFCSTKNNRTWNVFTEYCWKGVKIKANFFWFGHLMSVPKLKKNKEQKQVGRQ